MAKNSTTDIELLAGLSIDSSEQEILRAIKIIEKRLKANHDARFKLNVDIDETVINNTIAKLQNALKNKDIKIETQDSIQAITKEANAMLDVVDSAKRATQEKLEFAKANQKVRISADDTANAINRERAAMDNLDDIDVILQNLNMNGRQGNSVFQQFGATLRDAFSTYTVANLLQDAIYKVVDTGKEALDTVKKFDDINVDLQMATGADKDYVKGLISDYAELGGELGALTETVAESADTFLRQGRSMEETSKLISDAVVLSKVAKTEGEKASEILTATINGFQLAASEGSRVNDVLSSIDLNSASSAEGIGEALTKVASMANNAGVSLEKTAAMIATIKDVTQDADTTIGTSLKTVLSRMNQIRAGKFIDESTGEALNDVEKVLGTIGVSMRDVNGQFKEAEVIIDDVGTKWKSLDSNTQKAVTTAMGGVYQANKLVSLFDNYDKVIELTKVAEESAGTALQKFNDSYLTSLEAKTNALKSSLQGLATTTISDEFYGSVLDSTKAIVDMTTETGILKGALAGLVTAGAVYTFQHLATYLHDATQEFANLGEAMQITRGATGTITDIQRLVDLTGGLSEAQTRLLLSTNNLTDAQKVAILMNQGLTQEQAEQTISTWGVATAQQGATGATITWNNALRGLWTTLMANPLVLVTAAVTVGVTVFNKYKQAQEEAMRATKQSAEEANELGDKISNLTTEYLRLTKEVQTDESAREKLLSVQKDVLEALDLEASSIDELIGKYGSLSNAINQISVDKLKEAQIDLIAGLDVAKEDLLSANEKGFWQGNNIINATGDDSVKAFKELEKAGIITKGSYGSGGGAFVLTGDDETVEGALENYHRLEQALEALRDSNEFTAEELADNKLYQGLYKRYKEIKDEVEAYETAVDNLNENIIQQNALMAMQSQELPKTKEEFKKFKEGITQATNLGGDFMGEENDIRNTLDNYLSTLPEFKQFYLDLAELQEGVDGTVTSTVNTKYISDSQKKALNEYKDTLEQIAKIKEGNSDYSDLLTTFPKYDWSAYLSGAEPLDMALRKIASGSLADVKKQFKGMSEVEPLLEELRIALLKTFEIDDFGWSENLGHYDFLSNLLKEVQSGKVFNMDELTHAIGDYDLYGDIKKLETGFTIDEDALISLINDYAEEHNKSLQKVREALDAFGINPDTLLGKNSYKLLIDTSQNGNKNPDDFSDSIDWASQSISVLEEKVSDLERDLDNTTGWEAQIEAIDNLNTALSDLQTGYNNSATTYHDKYEEILNGISDENLRNNIRGSIENGTRFDIEPYVGVNQEELFNTIDEATDMYNTSEEAKNNAIEVGIRINENDREKLETELGNLSSERDKWQIEFDNATNSSDKNRAYSELFKATVKDFKKQIEIAEKEGDSVKAELLRLEEKETLRKQKVDKLEFNRDERSAERELVETELESAKTLEEKLAIYEKLPQLINREYELEKEIAVANKDTTEENRLQLEQEQKLYQTEQDRLATIAEYASIAKDLAFDKLDMSLSDDDMRNAIVDARTKTDDYYQKEIASATHEHGVDSNQVQSLKLQWQKELLDLKERELEFNREIESVEATVLEHNLNKLENQIDLNNGEGSFEQYTEAYKTAQRIQAEKLELYEDEVRILKEIEQENGTNSSAYRTQLYKVHDISLELDEWTKKVKEFGAELLSLPLGVLENAISGYEDQIESAEEALEGVQKQLEYMDSVIAGAQAYIQDQIDAQEELKKPIEEQLEAMEKANDERERALALEKAQYELERARSQRTVKTFAGEGKGFVYTQDQNAVRDAQETLADLEYDETVNKLKEQLEVYDEIIEDLQEIKDAWGSVAQNAQDALDIQKAISAVGVNGIMNVNTASSYEKSYASALSQEEALENEIDALEDKVKSLRDLIAALEEIVTQYQYNMLDIEQATLKMQGVLNENKGILAEINPDTPVSVTIQNMIDEIKKLADVPYILEDLFGRIQGEIDKFALADEGSKSIEETANNIAKLFETFYTLPEGSIADITPIVDFLNQINSMDLKSGYSLDEDYQELYDVLKELNPVLSEAETEAKETGDGIVQMSSQYEEAAETVDKSLEDMYKTLVEKVEEQQKELDKYKESLTQTFSDMYDSVQKNLLEALGEFSKKVTDSFESLQKQADGFNISTTVKSNFEKVTDGDGEYPEYHTGLEKGYVGNALSDAKRLGILQKAGRGELNPDEVIIKAKDDELVLTKMQQINIADSLLQRAIVPNVNIPDYSHLSNTVQKNNVQPFVQEISINCPNVTNEHGYNNLIREIQGLPLKAMQHANKK